MNIQAIRDSIPATRSTIYLNSGASAPSPESVVKAIETYLERQTTEGPFSPDLLKEGALIESELRTSLAAAIGASAPEMTLCNNTTEGLNIIANGMDWKPGDEIITASTEHPSGLLPWFVLRDRYGVKVNVVAVPPNGVNVADTFEAAMTSQTRLVCVSHVSWCTGLQMPVAEIVEAAHRRGAAVVVDGAQGPGHLNVKVKDLGCDFYALSGQKWLMGPHGMGSLYVSSSALCKPYPSRLGWASGPKVTTSGEYELWPDGRRYEFATLNHALMAGFNQAIKLYLENGPQAVFERILSLSDRFVSQLMEIPGAELLSPRGMGKSSGLVAFRLPIDRPDRMLAENIAVRTVVQQLWENIKVVSRWVDPPAIRFSFHIFNTEEEIDRVVEALHSIRNGAKI